MADMIHECQNYRGYRGKRQFGYLLDPEAPSCTRISNFILTHKITRHDGRVEFFVRNHRGTFQIFLPAIFFTDAYTNKMFREEMLFHDLSWNGNTEQFETLKKQLNEI